MVKQSIDIKALNLEELSGVVSIYPWYGAARLELCKRMSELGEGAWGDERFAEAALYIGSRRIVAKLAGKGREHNYSDTDVRKLLDSLLAKSPEREKPVEKKYVIVGEDYFSRDQYDSVRKNTDNIFPKFAQEGTGARYEDLGYGEISDFCTETLAEIYLEQGYCEQAKEIYSKLSLRYPEKSVYFASLIEKINKK